MRSGKKICGWGEDSIVFWSILARLFQLTGGLAIIVFPHVSNLAQITPDTTLGAESSVITPNINIKGATADQIDGGAIRNSNLFHSFREFNIKDGQRVYFSNPTGINNILGRVTGNNLSNILGTLGVNGNANLFLINPNGIVFGQNASLDLGGSFIGSTANAIKFSDSTEFSAIASQDKPLLTVTAPLGLQFGDNLGSIQVQGNGQGQRFTSELVEPIDALRVQPNQTLALVGGNLALEGGTIKTAGGRIELGSVAGSGVVSLTPIDTGFALGYADVPTFGDIRFSGGAVIDASGAGGGDIQVQGRRVTLQDGSQIEASTLGAESGGTLNVKASELIELIGTTRDGESFSGLGALVYPGTAGAGGNITVATEQLIVRDGAQIGSGTFGKGGAGNLSVSARESVQVFGTSADGQFLSILSTSVNEGATGNGGNLTVETRRLIVRDGAQIQATTFGEGNAGNLSVSARELVEVFGTSADGQFLSILSTSTNEGATGNGGNLTVETRRLIVRDGAQIGSGTFSKGDAGNLSVSATESIELIGTTPDYQVVSGLFTSVDSGVGDGGNLIVETGRLIVRDGAQIQATTFGEGNAGNLTVLARESVELIGTSSEAQSQSGLFSSVDSGVGYGGNLTVETGRLIVRDGAQIFAGTLGAGDAGSLIVSARESVEVIGDSSGLFTSSGEGATGDGGNLTVETGRLIVRDGSQIGSGTLGEGDAGTLRVSARESVELIGDTSGLFTSVNPGAIGDGSNLTVETDRLIIRDNGEIFAGTFDKGDAGSLIVSARSVDLDNQAGITTLARKGNGGNITMQLQDFLLLRRNSQISSTAGTAQQDGNGGNITINVPKGFIVAPPNENSDITANAFQGSGGKVNINAAGIFGLKPLSRQEVERLLQTTDPTKLKPNELPTSDITAISQTNPSLNGEVNLNTPDTDPSRGIEELPIDIVDVSGLINQNLCVASQASEFIITGKGGLPASPYQIFNADTTWEDWLISSQPPTKTIPTTNNSSPQKGKASPTIIEAQGWVKDVNGDVIFTAKPAIVTPQGTWLHPQDCRMLRGDS
ncbi:S-layer family protein [Rivularia sp. UHCC 0363]|uniref:S-layer family protein n=1 Tax=Rivularia sp. UHCC 0363 TaxID=3110244 RepID=UPI002B21E0C7|nr:S-layer family protein [Rivularia sp. UHCC 0363]MEA5598201.1 S-layer family protein [Rivularia sp. UHCC 0363]